jgi:hypothetical protein
MLYIFNDVTLFDCIPIVLLSFALLLLFFNNYENKK